MSSLLKPVPVCAAVQVQQTLEVYGSGECEVHGTAHEGCSCRTITSIVSRLSKYRHRPVASLPLTECHLLPLPPIPALAPLLPLIPCCLLLLTFTSR